MPFKKIIQSVTVAHTGTYSDNDTLFNMVEVQLPSKSCVLHGGLFIQNEDTQRLANDEAAIHFFQNTTNTPGTAANAFGLSAAQIKENGYLGGVQISQTARPFVMGVNDVLEMYRLQSLGMADSNSFFRAPFLGNIVLKSNNPGHTIFMVGTIDGVGSTGAFGADVKVRVILGVEY